MKNSFFLYIPLVAGIIVGVGLFVNRVFTTELLPSQSRSDALGIFAAAVLILIFLLAQQIQAKPPETVKLEGTDRFYLDPGLPELLKAELAWLSHTLLTLTPTGSIVVWYNDRVLHYRGILPEKIMTTTGKLTQNTILKQKPLYLVQLDLYPGKIEFDYLPANTQSLILQPLGKKGVLILGAHTPRSYTNKDEAWIACLADKLSYTLTSLEQ